VPISMDTWSLGLEDEASRILNRQVLQMPPSHCGCRSAQVQRTNANFKAMLSHEQPGML